MGGYLSQFSYITIFLTFLRPHFLSIDSRTSSYENLYVAGENISYHAREEPEFKNEGMSWRKMKN